MSTLTFPTDRRQPARPRHGVPVLLVARGGRDPQTVAATRSLAAGVLRARPDTALLLSFADGDPSITAGLAGLAAAGARAAVVVPLLLTADQHRQFDLGDALADARSSGIRLPVTRADVLDPLGRAVPRALLAALCRRLTEANTDEYDAVVLAGSAGAGKVARRSTGRLAVALGKVLDVPCVAAHALGPTPAEAVAALQAAGARRVAVASAFLSGDAAFTAARLTALQAGAVTVADPLGDAPELAKLIADRISGAVALPLGACA